MSDAKPNTNPNNTDMVRFAELIAGSELRPYQRQVLEALTGQSNPPMPDMGAHTLQSRNYVRQLAARYSRRTYRR